MTHWVAPWWIGITSDHLYETCPVLQRSKPELARVGWDRAGSGEINPEGGDVCGWCLRVWRARERAA